jgi:hypothetical protein
MTSTATYKLSDGGGGGGGRAPTAASVSLTYTTDSGLSITLDDSFSAFRGTHQLSDTNLTVTQPTKGVLEVSGAVNTKVAGRAGPRTEGSGIKLFLGCAEPSAASAPSQSTGVAVFMLPGSPVTFRAVVLTGTVSATDSGGGDGGGG